MAADLKMMTPVQMGTLTLKNRIAMAPMTRARSGSERVPNDLMFTYYTQRASAGLLISSPSAGPT